MFPSPKTGRFRRVKKEQTFCKAGFWFNCSVELACDAVALGTWKLNRENVSTGDHHTHASTTHVRMRHTKPKQFPSRAFHYRRICVNVCLWKLNTLFSPLLYHACSAGRIPGGLLQCVAPKKVISNTRSASHNNAMPMIWYVKEVNWYWVITDNTLPPPGWNNCKRIPPQHTTGRTRRVQFNGALVYVQLSDKIDNSEIRWNDYGKACNRILKQQQHLISNRTQYPFFPLRKIASTACGLSGGCISGKRFQTVPLNGRKVLFVSV